MHFAETMEVRIQDNRHYGRLEVNKYGFWGPVCPDHWTDVEADAACQYLKYAGGVTYFAKTENEASVVVGGFNCSDETLAFVDCPHKAAPEELGCQYTSGFPRRVAGVMCFKNEGRFCRGCFDNVCTFP